MSLAYLVLCLGTRKASWSQLQTLGLSGVPFCHLLSSTLVVPASLSHPLPALEISGQAEGGHMHVVLLRPGSSWRDMDMDTRRLALSNC